MYLYFNFLSCYGKVLQVMIKVNWQWYYRAELQYQGYYTSLTKCCWVNYAGAKNLNLLDTLLTTIVNQVLAEKQFSFRKWSTWNFVCNSQITGKMWRRKEKCSIWPLKNLESAILLWLWKVSSLEIQRDAAQNNLEGEYDELPSADNSVLLCTLCKELANSEAGRHYGLTISLKKLWQPTSLQVDTCVYSSERC